MTRLNMGLVLVGILSLFAATFIGTTPIPIGDLAAALFGGGDIGHQIIIWEIRLPRAIAAYLAGAALGASGAALQGLLRNPLAEPGVLGISAVSTLFATLTLYYGVATSFPPVLSMAAIVGAGLATLFLSFVAARVQSIVTLILVGVGLSSFAGAVMALLLNLAPNPFTLSDLINWTLGSVANRGLGDIALSFPFMAAGFVFLLGARRGLWALSLGEVAAQSVGVNVRLSRLMIIAGTGLATGAAISIAGAIGFVGIVAPHLIRPFVSHNPARTIIPSALLAGSILVLADILVRVIPTTNELKLGVVAALVGAPVFVWIASQRGRSS